MAVLCITNNTTPVNAAYDAVETSVDDTHIRQVAATSNYETTNPLQATKYGSGDHTHALIKFGLGTISGQTITSATLYMRKSLGENTHTIGAFRLLRNWVPAEATWNIYSTGNSWGTAGAEAASDIDTTATASVSPSSNNSWVSFDVTADVADFASGAATNYGWKLERTDGENDSTFLQFLSNDEVGDLKPELYVDYSAPAPGGAASLIGSNLITSGTGR